jgi:PD-(D/E)XK endonuclease
MGRESGAGVGRVRVKRERKPKKPAVANAGKASNNRGDVAEMQFMIQASNRGFGVAKPFGHNERYDVILDTGRRRLLRVQVKGSGCWRQNGFSVDTCWRTSRGREPYTPQQIDFLAAVYNGRKAHGRQIWYVIPVRALGGRLNIKLYPFGTRRDRHTLFEKYREAWKLLGEPGLRE